MNTIQLLLSHATVRELHNCSKRDTNFSESAGERMSIRGRLKTIGQIHLGLLLKK